MSLARLYAGLDVSQKTTAICIVDAKGEIVYETEVDTTPDAIASVLKPYRRRLGRVGQEAGNLSPWLEQGLIRARLPMVCLDPVRAHASLKTRLNKTDVNDARGLALLLAQGIYGKSHTKSIEAIRIRAILTLREAIVRKGVDLRRVTDMTERRLIVEQSIMGRRTLQSESQGALKLALRSIKASTTALLEERNKLDTAVRALARDHDVCRRLMTIPGVGPITALTFVAAVDDPHRFAISRNVGSYFGLTPRIFQSGTASKSGGISHRGDAAVRKALHAAGVSLIIASKVDCSMRRWAQRLAREKGRRIAYTAVARKLAVLMHHLWITKQDFDPTR